MWPKIESAGSRFKELGGQSVTAYVYLWLCQTGTRGLIRPISLKKGIRDNPFLRSIRSGSRFFYAPLFEALRQSFARLLQKPGLVEV